MAEEAKRIEKELQTLWYNEGTTSIYWSDVLFIVRGGSYRELQQSKEEGA